MSEETFCDENSSDDNGIVVQFFDLNDPLSRFRSLLEQLWHIPLSDYSLWLQGSQQLDDDKSLIQHGVEGEGKVQIKLQLKLTEEGIKMINIIDVLKPTEELEITDNAVVNNLCKEADEPNLSDNNPQWIESQDFEFERFHNEIPLNPEEWSVEHVRKWMMWAIRIFNLKDVDLDNWAITGREVCRMTIEQYKKIIPNDPLGHFWIHLQILQKCGQVAVCFDRKICRRKPRVSQGFHSSKVDFTYVNLWRFLLELLTDKAYYNIIRWINDDGEFQMVQPDAVARLWGEKKQKNDMTYVKLARALRYCYEADMISKVPGKRYVYKFDCDIKEIVGYSPMELSNIFTED